MEVVSLCAAHREMVQLKLVDLVVTYRDKLGGLLTAGTTVGETNIAQTPMRHRVPTHISTAASNNYDEASDIVQALYTNRETD